jgi:hypothetical protein
MIRYIDADALIERILKLKVVTDDLYGMGIARGIERAETAIGMQPTADVVAVVRCKDCKYWEDNNGGYPHDLCAWRDDETPDADDYCSYGERREE